MSYGYAYIGDFRGMALWTEFCPSCESNEDLEYEGGSEQWMCHYCEETWLGPPPPSKEV